MNKQASKAHLVGAEQVRRTVTGAGSHFFDRETMRFFSSRTARTGWTWRDDGAEHFVLVTSEKFEGVPHLGIEDGERRFTVRHFVVTDYGRAVSGMDDAAGFQGYATAKQARLAAACLVRELSEAVTR